MQDEWIDAEADCVLLDTVQFKTGKHGIRLFHFRANYFLFFYFFHNNMIEYNLWTLGSLCQLFLPECITERHIHQRNSLLRTEAAT